MIFETLQEKVAQAIADAANGCSGGCSRRPCEVDYDDARDILAALGLDDLDAAVERGADAMCSHNPQIHPHGKCPAMPAYLRDARRVLEAALTATPESETPDG